MTTPSPARSRLLWIIMIAVALAGIGMFFIPAFIIRPFAHQSARGLAIAMALRQSAPPGTLVTALICLPFAFLLWRGASLVRKIAISTIMLLVAFSAVMARLNYFEWMFHPVESPVFEAESASKLDRSEMVLAVAFSGDARAYPISQMAYHHVVNDVVGGVPIAVTY